jgi:hypothetical protein
MFDGVLQNYESTPEQVSGPAASPRQGELIALVLAVAGLAIVYLQGQAGRHAADRP